MSKYDAFADQETPYRDEDTLMTLYHEKELSQSEIADRLDCGIATVSRWMDKHDIESRSLADAKRLVASKKPAHYTTNNRGRELWIDNTRGDYNMVLVHRLLAVSEYGFDAVVDNHVHHKENVPWLNTPENITPKDPEDHIREHTEGNTRSEVITPGDCETIRESERSDAALANKYGVVERTIQRHRRGNCHH